LAISRGQGALCLAIAVTIWGSTLVITQGAMQSFGPLTLVVLRFAIAFVALLPLAWRKGFRWRDLVRPESLLLGLTGIALFYSLQNVALVYTSAASASLILAGIPILTALLDAWLRRQRLRAGQWLGIGLAVIGTALVSGFGDGSGASRPLLGNLLMVGAVLAWSAYTLLLKRAPQRDALLITAGSFGAGMVMVLPFAIAEVARAGMPQPSTLGVVALVYLSLISSALTMWLWAKGVQVLEASTATTFVNLMPVIGLLIALLAGDRLAPLQAAGGLLALAGVWLSTTQHVATRKPMPEALP
jgi:drug/metabolite transporter (DMT)-like permease